MTGLLWSVGHRVARWANRQIHHRLPAVLYAPSAGTVEVRHDLERDLHDKVAIRMSAVVVQLGLLSGVRDVGEHATRIDTVQEALRQMIDDVRQAGKLIYPPMLGREQLEPAVRAVADQRRLRLKLDLPSYDLGRDANTRVGLLLTDHLNTLRAGTIVWARVRGRRLVRVRITEEPLSDAKRRSYGAWLRCG